MGIYELSTGGINATIVDCRLVFTAAFKANACAVILAHNHPSGNLVPSAADRNVTNKLKEGGKLIDIKVIDHLIVTREAYYSFADSTLKKQKESLLSLPVVREINNEIIQSNYRFIKNDVQEMVEIIMDQVLNDPTMGHLVMKRG